MLSLEPVPDRGKAAVYGRASTTNQDTGLSTTTQATIARRNGEAIGYTITDEDIYLDLGISGMSDNRDRFRDLLLKCFSPENPYSAVIVTDISRLSRSSTDYFNYEEMFAEAGIELVSLTEPPANPQVKINTNRRMKAVMNESQVVDGALRTRQSQMLAVEMGFHIGWTRPFGYRKIKVMWRGAEHTKLAPHPEEWAHLLHMKEMAKANYSLPQIVEYADESGLKHPAGETVPRKGGNISRRGKGRFTADNTSYLLTKNDALLGWTTRGGEGSGTKILHKSEKVICLDAHEAAMTLEERELIIQNMASRKAEAKSPRAQRSPNPLSTMLVCGLCGATMQLHTSGGIARLMCANYRNYRKTHPLWCPNKAVRLDLFIARTLETLLGHILTRKVLKKLVRGVAKLNREFVELQLSRKKQINKRLKELGNEIDNLVASAARYGPANPIWGTGADARRKEAELLQNELTMIDGELEEKLVFLNEPERIIANALTLRDKLESEDLHHVGQMLQSLIRKGSILNKEVTLYYALPLPKNGTDAPIQTETISLGKLHKKSCPSIGNAGIDPTPNGPAPRPSRFPRTRGDRPLCGTAVSRSGRVPPQTRTIGGTLEFSFDLPKPANAVGGRPSIPQRKPQNSGEAATAKRVAQSHRAAST